MLPRILGTASVFSSTKRISSSFIIMDNCIFCNIIKGKEMTEIIAECDSFVVFRDIKPASDFHCLAVSKEHIDNPKSLNLDHKNMISDMRKTLNDLIKKQPGIEDSEIMFGFHWPPFNSVKHLHMHGISPTSKMGFVARMIFKKDSYWFRSVDSILDNLQPKTEL